MTETQTPSTSADLIDSLTQLDQFPAVKAIRHQRAKVVDATQGSYKQLFDPALPGLTLGERLRVAQTISRLSDSASLLQYYSAQLAALQDAAVDAQREAALQKFATLLTHKPVEGDRSSIDALLAAGLQPPEIITLAQLIAFLSYQVRVVAGLQALTALGDYLHAAPVAATSSETFVHPHHLPKPGEALRINGFTSETLGWKAWVPVLKLEEATPEQLAILEASHPSAKTSQYYLALIHQPQILQERSVVFNAIMYAPGGLSRAERELVSAAVSCINGCVYCASVHAQRFEQLAKRNDVIAQVFENPHTAGTNAREKALVQFAIDLTEAPNQLSGERLQSLREAGLTHLEILDALHAAAIFAWANRLMLNLGEAVHP
ncbi:peroxidase-related enzyme [Acidovorax sp. CCYZU-2555]|uniref:CMD domain-containing protein n=1 Tax=Acidovorax sp. CCYZU-2555 TaxID=2835042 RepID=UPI001BCE8E05|nr:peroxidase-related enzyme [Acidovorax sp. CCYZU-2555]MBS7776973.1 peroxidase-related enzyme [Acidovorax sp. CCYZU-2555]